VILRNKTNFIEQKVALDGKISTPAATSLFVVAIGLQQPLPRPTFFL
jgi:hypothetical protein